MKTVYFLLLFTGSFSLVLPVPRKYYLIKEGKTWSDAQAYCQASYTDLAIIQNNDDMAQLQSESQKQQLSSSTWIGLYNDINSWRWSFGNEPLGSLNIWKIGEPNNAIGHEECGAIVVPGWIDLPCTISCPFVCFDDSKTGTERFISVSASMTWSAAQSYCRQHYTDLATTRNPTETSIVKSFFNNTWTWIGLFRDSWKWINKTKFTSNSWLSGKFNNAQGNENCGVINNNEALDERCSDILPFFCYLEATKQQTVRLKIRSNQDMNDPRVEMVILEQIKQKLKDHGMVSNITVKWREQPDGTVFHLDNRNIL